MRTLAKIVTLLAALLSGNATAQTCGIDNSEDASVGPNSGVSGTCSNNGLPVECTESTTDGISCTGPEGDYSGYDLDTLVAAACGCDE
jgi:hypothetical protein